MKNTDTPLDELIILSYYGELSSEEQKTLDTALAGDAALRQRFDAFRESFERVKLTDAPEPDAAVLDRLERSILNATIRAEDLRPRTHSVQDRETRSLWATLRELFLSPQNIGYALAGGLAFMVIGIYIGSQLQNTPASVSPQTVAASVDTVANGAPLLTASRQVSDFLRRSQIYFATSVDHEVACEKCLPIQQQLPNRQIAKELLKEASALKMKSQNNPEIQKLITDIEYVLDNIGNNAAISPSQAEQVHHIASNAVCEVAARIDSANQHAQQQHQQKPGVK